MLLLPLAVALKPDVFEGLRFELTRPLNGNFFLTHRWDWRAWRAHGNLHHHTNANQHCQPCLSPILHAQPQQHC